MPEGLPFEDRRSEVCESFTRTSVYCENQHLPYTYWR